MAAKPKKAKVVDKWRKKRFFSILSPKVFQEYELGKTLAYEPAELDKRTITSNLMVLTGNIRKQDINVTFRVNKVLGDTGYTMLEKYEITPAAIKRKVRRQRDRLDASFLCSTKDHKVIRLKPLVITAIKTSRSVRAALKSAFVQQFTALIKKVDYDTLIIDIINDQLQKEIGRSISRISPVRSVDIRMLKYVGEQTAAEIAADEEQAKKAAERMAKRDKPAQAESQASEESVDDGDSGEAGDDSEKE
jgi:small subunit ribosomal protein S3Ae